MSLRYLLLNQLRFLKARGYRVLGVSNPGPDVGVVEAAGIRHVPVAMTRRFSPTADLAALLDLTRVFQRERVDVVHTHNPKPGLLGQLAARLAGIPVVVNTLHGFYFHDHMPPLPRRFYILMEQLAAAQSDHILSQNPEDIVTAINEHIAPPERIEALGNGIDLQRFRPDAVDDEVRRATRASFGFAEEHVVVGFVGRLVEEKGLLELFAALRALRAHQPDVRLLVIGPPDPEKADGVTRQAAVDAGVDDITVFAGLRHDLPELYASMDVFALPSHREGFPRSPMEAAAMAKPVVATDIRGCRETVVDGETGSLVAVRDPQALARGLERYVTSRVLRSEHGKAGRNMATARFDEQRVFERVADTYERLLARRRR
jgi:glycosyltransferase involved in cell wall biosynthesis